MVRVRMSARVYPPQVGTVQTLGMRVRYPAPWAQVSAEMRKRWKIVVQEVEKPRLHQALKAKEMRQYVYCGVLCWVVGGRLTS